jgi:hypothetical protein
MLMQKPAPAEPPPPPPPSTVASAYSDFVFRRLLDEVHLLLDFISSRTDRSLDGLGKVWLPGQPRIGAEADNTPGEVIRRISTLRYPPAGSPSDVASDAAFLIMVKDKLNRLAAPANGATVAFTALVIGSDREPLNLTDGSTGQIRKNRATRFSLAAEAYPGLTRPARRLSHSLVGGITALILLTLMTVLISGSLGYGRSLLDQLAQAQRRYMAAEAVIRDIEQLPGGAAAPPPAAPAAPPGTEPGAPVAQPAYYIRYCDRARLIPPHPLGVDRFTDERQARLCSALWDADVAIQGAKYRLRYFNEGMLMPLTAVRRLTTMMGLTSPDLQPAGESECGHTPPEAAPRRITLPVQLACEAYHTINTPELRTADLISGISNYLVTFCFTLLGAGVAILRDLYGRVRESTLAARDLPLSFGRLVLGMVAGAAIGLFYSPPSGQTTMLLSVQGLAFAAGYAVDVVFRWLDQRIGLVFVEQQKATADTAVPTIEPRPQPPAPAPAPAAAAAAAAAPRS